MIRERILRISLYAEAADVLGENTKSKGIDQATAFAIEMIENLERAAEHPDITRELADVLSAEQAELRIETSLDVNGRDDG